MTYEIGKWLNDIALSESPSEDIIAFNIGLFESDQGYMAYLIGSKEYDAEDDDWACNEDFIPEHKYHALNGSSGKEWQIIETEIISEAKRFLSGTETFFSKARVITVGFDDGELVKINT